MLQQISGFLTSEECDAIRASMDTTLASASTFTATNAANYQEYAETQRSSGLFMMSLTPPILGGREVEDLDHKFFLIELTLW